MKLSHPDQVGGAQARPAYCVLFNALVSAEVIDEDGNVTDPSGANAILEDFHIAQSEMQVTLGAFGR